MEFVRIAVCLCLVPAGSALAETDRPEGDLIFPGPYHAQVVEIVDGDTIDLRVAIWPGLEGRYAIRIRGIDAPETWRPGCDDERRAGDRATAFLGEQAPPGSVLSIRNVEYGTFAGRVIADAGSKRVADIAGALVAAGHAVDWTPGQDDVPWCLLLSADPDPE